MPHDYEDLRPFIVGVVIIALTLVFGIYIAATLETTFDSSATATITNESGAFINITGYTLSGHNSTWSSITATAVWANITDNIPYLVPVANYTLSSTGVLRNATIVPNATQYNNANISYSYAFPIATPSSASAADLVTAFSGGTSWISILIVVGFAVIVLGWLSEGLGAAAKGQGTSPVY